MPTNMFSPWCPSGAGFRNHPHYDSHWSAAVGISGILRSLGFLRSRSNVSKPRDQRNSSFLDSKSKLKRVFLFRPSLKRWCLLQDTFTYDIFLVRALAKRVHAMMSGFLCGAISYFGLKCYCRICRYYTQVQPKQVCKRIRSTSCLSNLLARAKVQSTFVRRLLEHEHLGSNVRVSSFKLRCFRCSTAGTLSWWLGLVWGFEPRVLVGKNHGHPPGSPRKSCP